MFSLQMRLATLLTTSSEALLVTHSLQQQLDQFSGKATGPAADAIEKFKPKLTAVEGVAATATTQDAIPLSLNRVNAAARTLYGEVDRSDAAPTLAQINATTAAEHDASDLMKQWEALKTTDLPVLNQALRAAGLSELNWEVPAEAEDLVDED